MRILFIILCMLFILPVYGQGQNEKGLLPTFNFSYKEYNSRTQNWAIVQDKRGIMYFGNNESVLEYDGVRWRKIYTSNETKIHSLSMDTSGKVYVGAENEFGFLSPNSVGKMSYHSLTGYLNDSITDYSGVTTIATIDGIYFHTEKWIFLWDGNNMKTWRAKTNFQPCAYINNILYVSQTGIGLQKLAADSFVLVNEGEKFADKGISSILPYNNDQILIITQNKGLYSMTVSKKSPHSSIKPFLTTIDPFLLKNRIYNGIQLTDDLNSLGTWGEGAVIIDSNGELVQILNKSNGLQDAIIQFQYLDNQQNLWLALGDGISRVAYNSPLSFFNDKKGLEGTIESITRHNGKIHVATNYGVFILSNKDEMGSPPYFTAVPGLSMECWDLLTIKQEGNDILLMALNNGVYQLDKNNSQQLVTPFYPWTLHQSSSDSNRIFIGLVDGISSIYRNKNRWIDEGKFPDITEAITSIAEDNNSILWLGTANGVIKLSDIVFENHKNTSINIERYDTLTGLVEGPYIVRFIANRIMLGTGVGLYSFDAESNMFKPDTIATSLLGNKKRYIHRLSEDHNKNLWLVTTISDDTFEIAMHSNLEKGANKWITTPFIEVSKNIIHDIYHDKDGISWLGGTGGLYRFDANVEKEYNIPYHAYIRQVTLGEDSVLFWGTYYNNDGTLSNTQLPAFKHKLPYSENSLTFKFAAPTFDDESSVMYKYFLDGFDDYWTDWNNNTEKSYTNLPEGKYFFRVIAKNLYENKSSEAVYEFDILAPWYRTVWAYIGYVLSFIGFVLGAINISTRGLQAIIRERTAKIVLQKEEIEEKNKDITDSINYAKKIQDAILPSVHDMESLFPESFIFFRPKDIVSGDFYWIAEKEGKALIAVADCTGHGVPGAFMSMIGNSLLNEIVNDKGILEPAIILDHLKEGVIKALKQTGETGESQDGMDIGFCTFDFKNNQVEFAGAYNSLFMLRDNTINEIIADRMPIGVYAGSVHTFTNHKIDLQKGDLLYLLSDGLSDQAGGPKGKKFMRKRIKEMFNEIQNMSMKQQKQELIDRFESWKGNYEQIDDICVFGVRI